MTCNGDRIIDKEKIFSLGRVTITNYLGDTIIDNYIIQEEQIVDYLTRYSGLTKEDLDPMTSKKDIVQRKTAYLKLKYFVENGWSIIGHGYIFLKKMRGFDCIY